MQNNIREKLLTLLLLLMINIISASLLHTHLYPVLEEQVYQQYESEMLHAKTSMNTVFKDSQVQQWQALAMQISREFNAESYIVAREQGNFSKDVFALINLPQSQAGVVDLETAMVYLPLNAQFVVELGPVSFDSTVTFIYDWFAWLCVGLLNLLLAFGYLTYQERQLQRITKSILALPMPFDNNNTIHQTLRALKTSMELSLKNHESRLLLQRDLLHGVAHEFRSPMARIQFALDMLADTPADEHEKLQQSMHLALADLDELVKELLYYARLKDSAALLQLDPLDLANVFQECVSQVELFYRHISFSCVQSEAVVFHGDYKLMKRLFTNLLRNAGRFASKRCVTTLTQTSNEIIITLDDDGVGIPPGKTERIFEPFTRLDLSRSRDSGGCGLGLAIVASIVEKHRGTISVIDSKMGGACFEIRLAK